MGTQALKHGIAGEWTTKYLICDLSFGEPMIFDSHRSRICYAASGGIANTPPRSRPCGPRSRRAACRSSGRSGCPGSRRRCVSTPLDLVAAALQLVDAPPPGCRARPGPCRRRRRRACRSASASRRARRAGRRRPACTFMPKSIRLHQHLHVPLRLHVAAHHAEARSHGLPSFVTIAGMIVWNGRLCGSRRLSVLVVEGEQAAAVLQGEAEVAGHEAASRSRGSCSGSASTQLRSLSTTQR